MSDLRSHPLVTTAKGRDDKEYFGQGWSHYGVAFQHTKDGVQYRISAWNTPDHVQINWYVHRVGADVADPDSLLFALTSEESRSLAAELGLDIEGWLQGALAACARDVTPGVVARSGDVVDQAVFHSGRAGDDI